MRHIVKFLMTLLIGFVLFSVIMTALSFIIYNRLTDEKPIATLYFEKVDKDIYHAFLVIDDQSSFNKFKLYGNQWRIDAQFIKIVPWANVLGIDSRYSLDRLERRYEEIDDQNSKKHFSYDLSDNYHIEIPQFLFEYNFLVDSEYGSSTYSDIDISKLYTVFRTQSGIIIRSKTISDQSETEDKTDLLKDILDDVLSPFN